MHIFHCIYYYCGLFTVFTGCHVCQIRHMCKLSPEGSLVRYHLTQFCLVKSTYLQEIDRKFKTFEFSVREGKSGCVTMMFHRGKGGVKLKCHKNQHTVLKMVIVVLQKCQYTYKKSLESFVCVFFIVYTIIVAYLLS